MKERVESQITVSSNDRKCNKGIILTKEVFASPTSTGKESVNSLTNTIVAFLLSSEMAKI